MKKSDFLVLFIAAVVMVSIGLANRPSSQYKDAEDIAAKANKTRQEKEYLSYDANLSMMGAGQSFDVRVYSKGNAYRFETGGITALSKQKKMMNTETNETEDFKEDSSLYNIVKITNITSNKYFHNRYAELGKKDKIGIYECTHVKFDPKSPQYDLCIDEKYGLPVKTTVGIKGIPFITLTLDNISDEKFDEKLLNDF